MKGICLGDERESSWTSCIQLSPLPSIALLVLSRHGFAMLLVFKATLEFSYLGKYSYSLCTQDVSMYM